MRNRPASRMVPGLLVVALLASMPALVAPAGSAAQAATSDWPMEGGNAARTGMVAGGGPSEDPSLLWVYGQRLFTSPIALDDVVVIGGTNGLSAFAGADGAERWHFPTAAPISATPATNGATIFAGNERGTLFALHPARGDELWRFDAGAPITETVWSDGLVLLGTAGGTVIAVDAAVGAENWRYATRGERVKPSPVFGGVVYVASEDGGLAALDAATGEERWLSRNGAPLRTTPVMAGGLVFAGGEGEILYGFDPASGEVRQRVPADGWVLSLAVTDDTVYVGTNAGTLMALDPSTGSSGSRFHAGGTVWSIVPTAAALYVASTDGHLYALDPASGDERWRFQTGDELETAAAIGTGRVFVGGSRAGTLKALDPVTGAEVWRVAGGPFVTPPAVAEGLVVLGGDDGDLVALDAFTGAVRWTFSTGSGGSFEGVAVVDGVVYAPADQVGLHAISAHAGEAIWLAEIPGEYLSAPAVVEGVAYVAGDYAGPLIAIDARSGERLWTAPADQARPSVAGGAAYTTWAGVVYAHEATTGKQHWGVQPGPRAFSTETIVGGDLIHVGSQDGTLYALDAVTGGVRWTFSAGSWIEELAASEDLVFAVTDQGELVAVVAATGVERWRFAGPSLTSSMAITANVLYAGSADGVVYALDAATGAERWALRVRGGTAIRSVAVAGGIVYAAGGGTLFAIGSRRAPPPAATSTTPREHPTAAPPAPPGTSSGTPSPGGTEPSNCTVAPRSPAELRQLARDEDDPEAPPPIEEATPVGPSALPAGHAADQQTVVKITAAAEQFLACYNAGDDLRLYALFSDDFIPRLVAKADLVSDRITAPPAQLPADDWINLSEVSGVRIFDDGRAGAFVIPMQRHADVAFMIFTRAGDRWLIDDLIPVDSGAEDCCAEPATPVAAPRAVPWQFVQGEDFEGVIVAEDDAPDFLWVVDGQQYAAYWTPTAAQIAELEAGLEPAIASLPPSLVAADRLENYRRQYGGFVADDRRLIRISFFCDVVSSAVERSWRRQVVFAAGGGGCYFRLSYDPSSGTFFDLAVNGPI